jgi:hypothetical protein
VSYRQLESKTCSLVTNNLKHPLELLQTDASSRKVATLSPTARLMFSPQRGASDAAAIAHHNHRNHLPHRWVTSPDSSAPELDASTAPTSSGSCRALHFGGMFQWSLGGCLTSQDRRKTHRLRATNRGHQRARYVLESARLV